MKAYLLDSNVVSELWKPKPSSAVEEWLDQADWYLPVPVLAELQEGTETCPSPVRRAELNAKLDELVRHYEGAILDWDSETARTWGRLQHSREVRRKPQSLWDSLIDAMGKQHGLVIATRNQTDFRHSETYDPWTFAGVDDDFPSD